MDNLSAFQRDGIGGNKPPIDGTEDLASEFKPQIDAAAECLDAAKRVPSKIEDGDEETLKKVAELIKKMRAIELVFEKSEPIKKAPFKAVIDKIGGFFKSNVDPLEKERKRIKVIHDDFMHRKEQIEKERLRKEEEDRRERQRVSEQRAKDAEETKNVAAQQLAESERLKREAVEARSAAISEMDTAVADVAEAKAELAQIKSDSAAIAADFARRIKDGEVISDQERMEKREAQQAKTEQAKAKLADAEQRQSEARAKAKQAKEEQQRRENEAAAAARQVRTAEREVKANIDDAVKHETAADRIEAKIEGKPGDLVRTHSEHGATSTMAREWFYEVTNSNLLNKEILWSFIDEEVKRIAYTKWAKLQTTEADKQMPGARAYRENVGHVR
jgi:DNA repair exonuclease SbcCD ATPase subunit